MAGFPRAPFARYRAKDEALAAEVMRAEAQAVADRVLVIHRAAETDWRAAAWWLERCCPEEWGPRSRIPPKEAKVNARIVRAEGLLPPLARGSPHAPHDLGARASGIARYRNRVRRSATGAGDFHSFADPQRARSRVRARDRARARCRPHRRRRRIPATGRKEPHGRFLQFSPRAGPSPGRVQAPDQEPRTSSGSASPDGFSASANSKVWSEQVYRVILSAPKPLRRADTEDEISRTQPEPRSSAQR